MRVKNCVAGTGLRIIFYPSSDVYTSLTNKIKHSILIFIELYKLVHFLSLLIFVSARFNRFEWRIDLLLMTQSSSGKDTKDMKGKFENRVTW